MNVVVEVESGVVEVVVVSYKCKGLVEAGSAMEVVVEVNLAAVGMGGHNIVVVVVDSKLVGAGVMVKGEEEEEEVSKLVGVVAGVKE